jgi:hypothetical protein
MQWAAVVNRGPCLIVLVEALGLVGIKPMLKANHHQDLSPSA